MTVEEDRLNKRRPETDSHPQTECTTIPKDLCEPREGLFPNARRSAAKSIDRQHDPQVGVRLTQGNQGKSPFRCTHAFASGQCAENVLNLGPRSSSRKMDLSGLTSSSHSNDPSAEVVIGVHGHSFFHEACRCTLSNSTQDVS